MSKPGPLAGSGSSYPKRGGRLSLGPTSHAPLKSRKVLEWVPAVLEPLPGTLGTRLAEVQDCLEDQLQAFGSDSTPS